MGKIFFNVAQSFDFFHRKMIRLKLLAPVFIFSFFIVSTVCQDKIQKVYVNAVRCKASDKFIYQNFSCFAKSYNRYLSTMNVHLTTIKPLTDIYVRR